MKNIHVPFLVAPALLLSACAPAPDAVAAPLVQCVRTAFLENTNFVHNPAWVEQLAIVSNTASYTMPESAPSAVFTTASIIVTDHARNDVLMMTFNNKQRSEYAAMGLVDEAMPGGVRFFETWNPGISPIETDRVFFANVRACAAAEYPTLAAAPAPL